MKTVRVQSSKLGEALKQIVKDAVTTVERSTLKVGAEVLTDNIDKNFPTVTGKTKATLKAVKTGGATKQKTIMTISDGTTAMLLEKGAQSPLFTQNNYPRFVTFDEEPSLEEWVRKKTELSTEAREAMLKRKGVFVGGNNTGFGQPRNKWFTKSFIEFKSELSGKLKNNIK